MDQQRISSGQVAHPSWDGLRCFTTLSWRWRKLNATSLFQMT